jgi:siderophore synthetase component
MMPTDPSATALALAKPLQRGPYERVQRAYVARSIAELLHERLLEAHVDGNTLRLDAGNGVVWTCRAWARALDFWHVDAASLERREGGRPTRAADAARFFLDFRAAIGMDAFTLAKFLEETAQTLYADACILERGRPTAETLAYADHQAIERAMEGHPWILVNKGRLGFGAPEQRQLAPEAGKAQALIWLAARKEAAECHTVRGLAYRAFLAHELGPELDALEARMRALGLEPEGHVLLPVHAWQYTQKIVVQYAEEIARGRLVPLGASSESYVPQQSIRTFQNAQHPERCFVKTALSILNTGQIRGLSPAKLRRAPLVTEWIRARLGEDETLKRLGTELLGEIATVTYEHPAYAALAGAPYQFNEQLGVLFRESPAARLAPTESLATMAALLYVDDSGEALVTALARRAGVTIEAWVEAYLEAYLTPLLHCFFAHETFFVAHGENTILVLENGLPVRVVLKDLVEEVQVSPRVRRTLAPELADLFYELDEALIPLFVLTDVFDGFFRYLADVLATHGGLAEATFWRLVARTVRRYEAQHPTLAASFARFDLWVPEFPRFCLNKYRLVLFGYADTAHNVVDTDPKFAGTLVNPIAALRNEVAP